LGQQTTPFEAESPTRTGTVINVVAGGAGDVLSAGPVAETGIVVLEATPGTVNVAILASRRRNQLATLCPQCDLPTPSPACHSK
jgi:hypothetical protein